MRPRPRHGRPHAELLEPRRLLDALVNDNDGATADARFTQAGAVLVAFDNTIVTAFNDSGSNAGSTNKLTGFARSTNGGATFTDGGTLPTNPSGDAGTPAMARDETTGRIYLATVQVNGSGIAVFRSDTDGASWGAPVQGTPGSSDLMLNPRIAVDNFTDSTFRGSIYLVAREIGTGINNIILTRSTDGGATFTPSGGTLIASGNPASAAPFVTVGKDHSVYVFWFNGNSIQMRKSTNLGVTFGAQVTVASGLNPQAAPNGDLGLTGIRSGTTTAAPFRTNAFPQVVVNPVSGNLYVTYANNPPGSDKADIFLVQSTTGGASWSTPVRVNDDATQNDQWFPTLAVTPDGSKLGVFYYSRQEDAANNTFRYYGRIATLDGATTTFATAFPISDVLSLPEFGRDANLVATFAGDYFDAVATSDAFHVVWSDNRDEHPLPAGAPRKDPNIYYDRIPAAASAPEVVGSNFNYATLPHRLNFVFNQDLAASIGLDDIVVQQLPAGPTFVPTEVAYDPATNTVTFSFGGQFPAPFPEGRYRARLIASGITGPGGQLPADQTFEFTFLHADANGDGRVNLADFNVLAANFGRSPRDFTQGDFDYSGNVNLSDFNILAARFGNVLASPGRGIFADGGTMQSDRRGSVLDDLLA